MEYIYEIGWFILWPLVLLSAFKLILRNINAFEQKIQKEQ